MHLFLKWGGPASKTVHRQKGLNAQMAIESAGKLSSSTDEVSMLVLKTSRDR